MLAEQLTSLRRARARRSLGADELPASVDEAYAVAGAALAYTGQPVAGWKLGATTASTQRAFATETVYFGALTDSEVWMAGISPPHVPPPLFRAEAEIAFRLGVDVPAGLGAPVELAPEAIFDAWTPALEAPYSCIENLPDLGLIALLSDRCAAGALFLGPPRFDVNDPAIAKEIAIMVEGQEICVGSASEALLTSPVAAALDFLDQAKLHGVNLKQGQWISTGGITPCVNLPADGKAIGLRFGGEDAFTLDLVLQPQ